MVFSNLYVGDEFVGARTGTVTCIFVLFFVVCNVLPANYVGNDEGALSAIVE